MKKFIIIFLILLLILPIVLSQGDNSNKTIDLGEISDNIKNKMDAFFNPETSISISQPYLTLSQIIFGVKGEIALHTFIVLIGLWIVLFLIIGKILTFTPIFKAGLISWLGAFIITSLVGLTGAILQMAIFFLNFLNIFDIIRLNGFVSLLFAIIILVMIFFGAMILINLLGKEYGKQDATKKGRSIAKFIKMAEVTDELGD